jgi:protein-tyrosine-phosphatase
VDAVLAPGDLVVAVCDEAREVLGPRVAVHWSIPDPVRIGTDAAFDAAFDELDERIRELARQVDAA